MVKKGSGINNVSLGIVRESIKKPLRKIIGLLYSLGSENVCFVRASITLSIFKII